MMGAEYQVYVCVAIERIEEMICNAFVRHSSAIAM